VGQEGLSRLIFVQREKSKVGYNGLYHKRQKVKRVRIKTILNKKCAKKSFC
jgi:hypothetical protein